ncbi:MAG: hypothetical protein ACLU4J_16465 [Butyricimonas paravirosa]
MKEGDSLMKTPILTVCRVFAMLQPVPNCGKVVEDGYFAEKD